MTATAMHQPLQQSLHHVKRSIGLLVSDEELRTLHGTLAQVGPGRVEQIGHRVEYKLECR